MATKFSLYTLGLVVILLTVITIVQVHNYAPTPMDWKIYSRAANIYVDGLDPYDQSNIKAYTGEDYPFRYAPITLPFFEFITNYNHYIIWGIVCLLIFLIMWRADPEFKPMLFFILLLTGFMSPFKNFTIGNIGLLEMLFFTGAVYFLFKKKYELAAVSFAFMAIFKAVPLAYALVFLLIPLVPFWKKVWYGCITGMVYIFLQFMGLVLFPTYFKTYFGLSFGGYPVVDSSGYFNPTTISVLKEIFFNHIVLVVIAYILIALILLVMLAFVYEEIPFEKVFALGVISIMLLLPELKHFSYVMAIIPIYLLIKDMKVNKQIIVYSIVAIVPLVEALLSFYAGNVPYNTMWMFFYNNTPWLCLVAAFIICYKDIVKTYDIRVEGNYDD